HGTENTAGDRPEVTLTASIIAGPSVGIAGLVEAGVEGDITAKIDFDLNDVPTPGSNPLEYDGRLTLDELSQRAEQGLECVFDTSGQLSAGLTGFLWVGVDTGVFGRITLYENRISLYRETLATFELGCKDLVPPTLGTVNGGVLTLAYQPSADFPVRPNGDNYQVSQFTDDDVTKIRVQANGFTQNFSGVTGIEYNGTAAADNVVVTNASVPVTLRGSAGNDMLRVIAATGNMATRELFGDDGDDVLIGSDGVDILHGGAGNDELFGGKGVDVVHGSAGADELFWNYGDGADDLQGGTDADIVKLSGFDFDDATQSTRAHNDTVTLTKAGTAVSVNWQRGSSAAQTVTFDAAEQIQLDASAGGDAITVNDLRGSAVTDVVVNFGTSDTEQTVTNIVDPPEFINGVAITSEDVITRTSLPDLAAHRWFQHRR
ncbi:MAG: hypothetical protein HYV60_18390, partial [Planctomycetia bacterium]|nr:hypothetical protein [Planctomycetia bacterium]